MEFGFKPTVVMVRLIQRLVSVSVCVTLVDSSYAHKMIELIFGRPFVKRFALCYGTVVCLYLSVTLVYCGQTVGWIKMKLGTGVGLGPDHILLDGDPAPLP